MLRFQLRLLCFVCVSGFWLVSHMSDCRAQISIKLSTTPTKVVGKTVTIGDVASVECESTAKQAMLEKLDVEEFPQDVDAVVVSRQQILIRLQLAGHVLQRQDITGPNSVIVQRRVANGFKSEIKQAIEQQIVSQFGVPQDELQITIDPKFNNSAKIGSYSAIDVSPWLRPDLPLGRQSASVNLTIANQNRAFNVPITIAVMRDLAVASREITAGKRLTAEDVRSVRRPVSSNAGQYLTLEQAIGQVAKANIEKYGLVTPSRVRTINPNDEILIRRNSTINVLVERGGLRVTLLDVKAVSDGKRNGRVDIVNPNNGERMSARVVDPFTARIY